jgi:flagellar basal-body rod modification protein FlgD
MTTGASAVTAKTDTMANALGAATDTSKTASATKKLSANFDTFLTMLTTQLKHQDPLSPMDSTQFTNQLVQFASVEQQISANTNLESLIKIQKLNQTSSALGYLGQTIETVGNELPLQDGRAGFSYTLGEDANATAIVIRDSNGKMVRSLNGEMTKGRHDMSWDGKDQYGNTMADGRYAVEVVAAKSDGTAVDSAVTVMGRVTDVASDETSGTLLAMSGVVTTLDKILTIRDTASLAKAN